MIIIVILEPPNNDNNNNFQSPLIMITTITMMDRMLKNKLKSKKKSGLVKAKEML